MLTEAPRVLFMGLSASGHGGIQRFNRRVAAALAGSGSATRTAMLADGRGRLLRTLLAFAPRSDILLLGHINLLPLAAMFRILQPRGRVILFAHGIEIWGDPVYRRLRRFEPFLLRRLVNRVAIVSAYSQRRMSGAFGLPEDRFALFLNAVDLSSAPPPKQRESMILAVARLGAGEREKHIDKLVRALPLLPHARLTVIGDGPMRGDLRALADELGVGNRVQLPGGVSDEALVEAYAQAAVFALPSSKEGFGIVFLEAWAHGLPVVGSRIGAAAEVIADGFDGFTVDPDDVPALAAVLRTLLDDPALAERMGMAGRAKVARSYSGDVFTANLRRLIAG
jgi:phosphatidylinositol alpha-1,6-mannosyltransferase